MDTIDRPDSNVPARFPTDSSRLPAPIPMIAHDLAIASTPPSKVSPQVILRGLSRHWWRILLISMVVYAPLAYGIWAIVEPTFEAVSVLRIEPVTPELFGPGGLGRGAGDQKDVMPYLLTQIEIIKSDTVLQDAITNPTVLHLERIKRSEDPLTDCQDDLAVNIVASNTYLIRVALESRVASEAAAIVNAVVDAYLKQHSEYHQ